MSAETKYPDVGDGVRARMTMADDKGKFLTVAYNGRNIFVSIEGANLPTRTFYMSADHAAAFGKFVTDLASAVQEGKI